MANEQYVCRTIPAGYRVRVWTARRSYVGTLVGVWLATDFQTPPSFDAMVTLDVPSENAQISFPATQILSVEIFEAVTSKQCHTCGRFYTGSVVDHGESQEHNDEIIAGGLTVAARLLPKSEIAAAVERVAKRRTA